MPTSAIPTLAAPPAAIESARRMLASGDARSALEVLDGKVTDPDGLALLGDAWFLSGRYDRAEAAWRQALGAGGDPTLAQKAERAAENLLTRSGSPDGQMPIFAERFDLAHLFGGPHPGDGAAADLPTEPQLSAARRLAEAAGAGTGAILGAVGKAVFHRLVQRAGAGGIDDGVWTTWHRAAEHLPETLRPPFQILKLAFMRDSLFANNLVRPYPDGSRTAFWEGEAEPPEWARWWRSADGSWNDLNPDPDGGYDPMVGAAYTRFFRNVGDDRGLASTWPRPNPATEPVNARELSRALLAAKGPRAEIPHLNLWAAAWIQFMVHDWVSHGTPDFDRIDHIPLAPDDPLRRYGIDRLQVPATRRDPTRRPEDAERPPTFLNEVTHWWDASQIYGSDPETQRSLRTGVDGKLTLDADGFLPVDPATGVERTGFMRNWWVGIAMFHTLFAREHNAVCDHLRGHYPDWSDERLFQTARLINSASLAKIHTIEWTPAILANRTIHDGMQVNWYGLLTSWFGGKDKEVREPVPISSMELGGIVGGPQGTFARYGLSEEFTAVYRMHSLLPDAIHIVQPGGERVEIPLRRVRDAAVNGILREHGLLSVAASMGVQHPCALVNNNYPAALQDLTAPGMPVMDLGAIEIYRDRERGIPPFNQLRAELGLKRVPSFDALTDDPETATALRRAYGTDEQGRDRIDDVDLLIGTLCEGHRPAGFGFGETLFQVFVLNASWRLLGDRFYTDDYRPEVYTQEGLEWIDRVTFKQVLLRHFPELEATGLGNVGNAFEPWDEGRLDPARHPIRAFDKRLASDPWAGDRARG